MKKHHTTAGSPTNSGYFGAASPGYLLDHDNLAEALKVSIFEAFQEADTAY